jgi:hypothetical protein
MNPILEDHTGPELVDLFHSIESHRFQPGTPAYMQTERLKDAIIETLSDKYPRYLPYVGIIQEQEGS